jgi:hypothetical protein
MLRRCTLLTVLLFMLSVIAPAVMACSVDAGCCPDHAMPCGSQPIAQPAACCVGQPLQASSLSVASAAARDHQPLDGRLPAISSPAIAGPAGTRSSMHLAVPPPCSQLTHEQLLYLLTGRLRL